jgi:hypothetical protein
MTDIPPTTNPPQPTERKPPVSRRRLVYFLVFAQLIVVGMVCACVAWVVYSLRDPVSGGLGPWVASISGTEQSRPTSLLDGRTLPARPSASRNQVRIFFTTDGRSLEPQVMHLPRSLTPQEKLRFVLEELLRGPSTDYFLSPIPAGTTLRGAYIKERTAIVDLDGAVRDRPIGGVMSEWLCVGAIVDTVLENVDAVDNVRFLINGQSVDTLWGDIDMTGAFAADVSLIAF